MEFILDIRLQAGYSGTRSKEDLAHSPTYQNMQDFAEAMRVMFDPSLITYQELLTMMFAFATPADPRFAGTQYRFAIFLSYARATGIGARGERRSRRECESVRW